MEKKESWKTSFLNYSKFAFSKNEWLKRGLYFSIGCIVVLFFSLSFYFWALNQYKAVFGDGFIRINIILNDGIAFSMLWGNFGAIVALQTFSVLILIGIIIFSTKWFYTLLLGMTITGSLFNLIDRFFPKQIPGEDLKSHAVLDYLQFNTKHYESAIFNFPDVFILIGIIGCALILIIRCFIVDKDNKEVKK